jgi:hypothetical protein
MVMSLVMAMAMAIEVQTSGRNFPLTSWERARNQWYRSRTSSLIYREEEEEEELKITERFNLRRNPYLIRVQLLSDRTWKLRLLLSRMTSTNPGLRLLRNPWCFIRLQ